LAAAGLTNSAGAVGGGGGGGLGAGIGRLTKPETKEEVDSGAEGTGLRGGCKLANSEIGIGIVFT